MSHFLKPKDPIFLILLEELRESNNLYHGLKTQPITAKDLFMFLVTLQNIYTFITDAVISVNDWQQGQLRIRELIRLKHEFKEFEELIFDSLQKLEVSFTRNSERFVSASSKLKALFNLEPQYRFKEY